MPTYVNLPKPVAETLALEATHQGTTQNSLISHLIVTGLRKQSLIAAIAKKIDPEDPQRPYDIMRLTNDPEKIVSVFPELAGCHDLEIIYG